MCSFLSFWWASPCKYTTVCTAALLLMVDTRAFLRWPSGTMWMTCHEHFCAHFVRFYPLGIYLGVEILHHRMGVCFVSKKMDRWFCKAVGLFYTPTNNIIRRPAPARGAKFGVISFFLTFYYSWFVWVCQCLLYGKVTQSYVYSFSHIIFHVPSQVSGHGSLCCTVDLIAYPVLM